MKHHNLNRRDDQRLSQSAHISREQSIMRIVRDTGGIRDHAMARVARPRRKLPFGDDCEKARAVALDMLSFAEFCLDGVCRCQLAISMWPGARGAGM